MTSKKLCCIELYLMWKLIFT